MKYDRISPGSEVNTELIFGNINSNNIQNKKVSESVASAVGQ
ncbi:MAG: hypothetical protein AB8B72_03360 [Crocinitomicaceae bacterium]